MNQQQPSSLALLREMFPGQINIDFLSAARVLGLAPQTAYNLAAPKSAKKSGKKFPVKTFKLGRRRVCSIVDLAATLDSQRGLDTIDSTPIKRRGPGRPTNTERLTQRSASQ